MELPAGITPKDCNIELFADPDRFGKCLFIQQGRTRPFHELPLKFMPALYHECFEDKEAVKALEDMGVPGKEIVEHYNFCIRGALNAEPDINAAGKRTTEYFDCGRRGKCIGEGRVCKLTIHGTKFTPRELECIRLSNQGNDYLRIQKEMGFRSRTAVNSLMTRCRIKLEAKDRTELLIKSQQLGIV